MYSVVWRLNYSQKGTKMDNPEYEDGSFAYIQDRCGLINNIIESAENSLSSDQLANSILALSYVSDFELVQNNLREKYPTIWPVGIESAAQYFRENKLMISCDELQKEIGDTHCKKCPYNGKKISPSMLGRALVSSVNETNSISEFPIEALPKVAQEFTQAASIAIGCPSDYIAGTLLTLFSSLIGKSARIQLKKEWVDYAAIWLLLVGKPSWKKTPAMQAVLKYFKPIEMNYSKEYKEQIDTHVKEMLVYEVNLKEWKKNPTEDPPLPPKKPTLKRLSTTNITMESLCELLPSNPKGLALICDEASGFIRSMNEYKGGKGSDRSYYMSMWSNTSFPVDRKGIEPLMVETPFLSIIGGIQPDLLSELKLSSGQDGMNERFLYCYPNWEWNPSKTEPLGGYEIPEIHKKNIQSCFQLLSIREGDELLQLSDDAKAYFHEVEMELCHSTKDTYFDDTLDAYYQKMLRYFGRLALIIHVVKATSNESQSETLELQTLKQARQLLDYFLEHAKKALGSLSQSQEESQVQKTLKWILKRDLITLGPRELVTYKVAGCKKVKEAIFILKGLQDYGHGIWVEEERLFILVSEGS